MEKITEEKCEKMSNDRLDKKIEESKTILYERLKKRTVYEEVPINDFNISYKKKIITITKDFISNLFNNIENNCSEITFNTYADVILISFDFNSSYWITLKLKK
jgi:phenylalanyl-tRNA synthetase alpha subunit